MHFRKVLRFCAIDLGERCIGLNWSSSGSIDLEGIMHLEVESLFGCQNVGERRSVELANQSWPLARNDVPLRASTILTFDLLDLTTLPALALDNPPAIPAIPASPHDPADCVPESNRGKQDDDGCEHDNYFQCVPIPWTRVSA